MKIGNPTNVYDSGTGRTFAKASTDNYFSSNGFSGFAFRKSDKPRGRDVTAKLMGDPAPGRSALDLANGSPEIPPDPRRDKWKGDIDREAPGPKRKRARRGATHFGVKL